MPSTQLKGFLMSTQGFSGMGSTMVIETVTLAEIESYNLGSDTLDSEEILTIDSSSFYPDLILGAFHSGQIQITAIFQANNVTGNYKKLKTLFDARAIYSFIWTFLNGAKFSGSIAITELGRPQPPDAMKAQRLNLVLTASGQIAFTGT